MFDGVSVNRPCCAAQDDGLPCRTPLDKPHDLFCPIHQHLQFLCAISGCTARRQLPHLTCCDPDHRAIEEARPQAGTSAYQLKLRIQKTHRSTGIGDVSQASSKKRKRWKKKNTFTRTWTHNEELAVRPCGIIISRATMFQAEAISGVKACEFFVALFAYSVTTAGFHSSHVPASISWDDTQLYLL